MLLLSEYSTETFPKMSLFLGNLSPHIRQEDLERVFWRFGRSKVQLKDGYGFVVYDIPADAERALRALRGKIICGEQIFLSWSNKQPRPFKQFPRSNRFSRSNRERNFTREEHNGVRNCNSEDQRDFRAIVKSSNRNPKIPCCDGHDDMEDNEGDGNQNLHERPRDDGGTVRFNSVENDRWGAPTGGTLNDGGGDNATDFDRYEPYHGYDGGDENGDYKMTSPPERALKDDSPDHSRPQQTCFNCGLESHIKRNCPQLDGRRRRKFNRHGRQQGDEFSFRSRGRQKSDRTWGSQGMHGERPLPRHLMSGRKVPGSGNFRSLPKKQEGLFDVKENRQPLGDSRGIKRSRKEHENMTGHHRKTARSGSSQQRSDSAPPCSHSQSRSSKSVSPIRSHSHLRSLSRSRSTSRSSYSRSRSLRSRSRSRSAKSLSLSISLGWQSSSLPNEVQIGATGNSQKVHLDDTVAVESKDLLLETKYPESKVDSDNLEQRVTSVSQKDENPMYPNTVGDLSARKNESEKISDVFPSEEGTFTAENSSSENFKETGGLTRPSLGKPSPHIPMSSQGCNTTRMSTQEMCLVLKHYGLMAPEETELHLPVDAYFGAARLWPWEMIYYRRLKKGPISTENYARKVAQNTEFGIVDKYIRSSSGWGEHDENV